MCGHFWSRDKDGGHTIWSAIAKNPMQQAYFMALCVTADHRFIYSLLDAVPPIHAESSHVATDKVPSM